MLDDNAAREILKKSGASPEIIEHCEAVHSECMRFIKVLQSKNPALKINKNLVSVGALLHDIGRSKTHGVDHGIAGAAIIRSMNPNEDDFFENVARICQKHIGGGISPAEASKLGFPPGEYVPRSLEEKIVAYCDNLVDEENGAIVIRDPEWVVAKYEKKHGKNSDPARLVRDLNKFFEKMI